MKNAVGREIPDFLLKGGREVYQGKNYMDGKYIRKASPRTRRYEKPQESKIVENLAEALRQCGAKSGMTFSFHHHLRDGDYVVNMVMKAAIEELGLEELTIAASSLGNAHDPIADYIEQGKVVGIQTSGIRGRMGEVVSAGKLRTPAIIRSHGGRPRAIEGGEVHIDIAFIAAPTSDCVGNCRGIGGKSNCGSMGYAMTDAKYADHVVVVTDCLVDFPNMPASVEAIDVDAVVVVDSIGNPKKIASAAALWVKRLGWSSFPALALSAACFFGVCGAVLLLLREPLVTELAGELIGVQEQRQGAERCGMPPVEAAGNPLCLAAGEVGRNGEVQLAGLHRLFIRARDAAKRIVHIAQAVERDADIADADLLALRLELLEVRLRALRRHIAAVEERVDVDLGDALLLRHLEQRVEVTLVAVHAARGDEAHEMNRAALFLGILHDRDERLVLEEIAVLDVARDARELLVDEAAGADIRVTDFRVAHVTVGRKSYRCSVSLDGCVRPLCH